MIVVVGENLVDLLVSPEGEVHAVVGGGPLNVARAVACLGGHANFVSSVSADAFGTQIRRSLDVAGVELTVPEPAPEPTTLAVVEMNPAGAQYHFHLSGTASFCVSASKVRDALSSATPWAALYLGTLGLVVEPMASLAEELATSASPDTLVVLDPNCRPSATSDADGFRRRVERLSARADVVKVSTEDIDFLSPGLSVDESVRDIRRHGARCVIVTDGARPIRVVGEDFDFEVAIAPTEVVDTVGAGDALVGGLLRWWTGRQLTRRDVGDAEQVRHAVSAAIDISRITCQRRGADVPRADEVRDLDLWSWL